LDNLAYYVVGLIPSCYLQAAHVLRASQDGDAT